MKTTGPGECDQSGGFTTTLAYQGKELPDYGWHQYGPARGGTPGVLLPGGKHYLMFFHTRTKLPKNWMFTYLMGAITFCAKPPFNLHAISHAPIANSSLYSTGWVNRATDYVVFPMGLVIEEDGKSLWLSLGSQDREGILTKIDLHSLLASMRLLNNSGC